MSVTAAPGFVAAGCHAGVKRRRPDLALLATADRKPVVTAAVFTRNLFVAAPVILSRGRIAENGGRACAVIVNSGNANAGTGAPGLHDAEAMGDAAARALGVPSDEVLVCSTGTIGDRLPVERILKAVPGLAGRLSAEGASDAAEAILTTDKVRKEAVVRGRGFTIGGMAKGCGMIAPNMATMLAFLTTDAEIDRDELQLIFAEACDQSFNRLNVDGATSTNDTALIFANGRGGRPDRREFAEALHSLCRDLTLKMARDAEGMTRMVHLRVTGARNDAEARIAAKAVAENNLVKCSWHGGDPYWGRLLAAAGSAGIAFDAERSHVAYGPVTVSRGGVGIDHDEARLAEHMARDEIEIEIGLGVGDGQASTIGIDLGPGYIAENVKTS